MTDGHPTTRNYHRSVLFILGVIVLELALLVARGGTP